MWVRGVLLFILLSAMLSMVYGGNCSKSPSFEMKRDRVIFEVKSGGAKAHAARNGQRLGENYIGWTLDMMVERLKSEIRDVGNDLVGYQCVNPQIEDEELPLFVYPGIYIDPLTPREENVPCRGSRSSSWDESLPCGQLVSHYRLSDFDCWSEKVFDTLEGIDRERVITHLSIPNHPTFNTTVAYELLAADLNYTFHHPSGSQQIVKYRYAISSHFSTLMPCDCFGIIRYNRTLVLTDDYGDKQRSKDHLKINVGIDNFPWVNHDYVHTLNETLPIAVSNNASWLSVWWNIEAKIASETSLKTNNTVESVSMQLDSIREPISLSLELLKTFLLDGVYTVDPRSLKGAWEIERIAALNVTWNFVMGLCGRDSGRWSNLWYDPSFTALFLGDLADSPALSPKEQSNRKSVGIAVGVSLAVLVILIAVLGILALKSPVYRKFFRPFAARGNNRGFVNEVPQSSSNQWTHSTKPTD